MTDYPWTQEDRTELTEAQEVAQAEIENVEVDTMYTSMTRQIAELESMIRIITSIPAVCDIEDSITMGLPAEVRNPITDARKMVTK